MNIVPLHIARGLLAVVIGGIGLNLVTAVRVDTVAKRIQRTADEIRPVSEKLTAVLALTKPPSGVAADPDHMKVQAQTRGRVAATTAGLAEDLRRQNGGQDRISPSIHPGDPRGGGPTGRIYTARRGSPGELSFIGLSEGEFDMGSQPNVGSSDEHPQRRVRVSAFAIGRSEVTQAQWAAVVQAAQKAGDVDATGLKTDPSSYKGATRPVENVSWCDAVRFANALSRLEGKRPAYTVGADCEKGGMVAQDRKADGYRLPTEAEWEYAARAGTSTAYSFGDDSDQFCTYGNIRDGAGSCPDGYPKTAPVCSFRPNPWGLCDVHGNVWEWTGDWYASTYDAAEVGNPVGAASGVVRVLRGGSWFDSPDFARSAYRFWYQPSVSDSNFGFRLVLPVPASEP